MVFFGLLHSACHGWVERWVGVQRGGSVARQGDVTRSGRDGGARDKYIEII